MEENIVESEYNTFTVLLTKKRHIKNTRRRNLTSLQINFFYAFLLCPLKNISDMMNICRVRYKYNFFYKQLLKDYFLFSITGI